MFDERDRDRGWRFNQFLHNLLVRLPGVTDLTSGRDAPRTTDVGADFMGSFEGRPMLVIARSQTPQTRRRLQQLIDQLRTAWDTYRQHQATTVQPHLVVAFPGVLSPQKETQVEAAHIEIWDGQVLQRMARQAGLDPPEFLAIPEEDEAPTEREPANQLLRELSATPTGRPGWTAFERFAEDLLTLLFCPPLNPVITQSSNDSGVNRRDFIMPNYADDGFWKFLREHYRGDFVVAEAKNHTTRIGKSEVLQLANYLTHHGTGLVGLLLTRHGFATDAVWTSREQWVLHSKLIVGLSDDDYRQMLRTKRANGDPAEVIRQRIEDFRLRI